MMKMQPELLNDDGDFMDSKPPMMEFTNDEKDVKEGGLQVPQIGYIGYADSVGQLTQEKYPASFKSPAKDEQFPTFNRNGQ